MIYTSTCTCTCHYTHTVSVQHYILYTLQCSTDTHIGIGADTTMYIYIA